MKLRGQCLPLPQRIHLFCLLALTLTLHSQAASIGDPPSANNATSSVERVGDAVSMAVSQISETIRNNTAPSPIAPKPLASPHGAGQAALQSHRDAAAGIVQEDVVENPESAPEPEKQPDAQADADRKAGGQEPTKLDCEMGRCVELETALLVAIEGEACRSVFVNGKCPAACVSGITQVTSDEMWESCAAACQNDVVSGAADRWATFCSERQETFIEQGKEAVKSLVGDSLATGPHTRLLVKFFFAVIVLIVAVGYGYRRGAGAAQIAYRLQKRRLMGRKNSDINLPI